MPHARLTDPSTSHAAAASVTKVTFTQRLIYANLMLRSMTDQQLVEKLHAQRGHTFDGEQVPFISESGIRSRRAELVDSGLVKDSGLRVVLASGRKAIVWQVA